MAAGIADTIAAMRANPADIRFADACKVAESAFGPPRQKASSHLIYRMPWPGDPRVNLQAGGSGKAKAYQIRQLLAAYDKMKAEETRSREGAASGDVRKGKGT